MSKRIHGIYSELVDAVLNRVERPSKGPGQRFGTVLTGALESDVAIATGRLYPNILTALKGLAREVLQVKALDSLPAEPLDGDIVLALNETKADMVVLPVSYYQEDQIYSMAIMTDDYASMVGFDGDKWVEVTRSTADSEEEFDPEEEIDKWMQETHPELYKDPEFEVTSEDYELE